LIITVVRKTFKQHSCVAGTLTANKFTDK